MSCRFGMPSLITKGNIEDNILLCKELGLNFIELNMNLPYCMNIPGEKMARLKKQYDVDFTLHFPEDIDFGHFYEEIRQSNIQLFDNITSWAYEFGAQKINLHLNPGVYFTLPGKKVFVYEKHKDIFIEKFIDSMVKIIKIANPLGIKVCVENMKACSFIEETFKRMTGMDGIYFTWDVGHDAMSGYIMEKIYSEHPEKVSHMHLHDYNGISDHQVVYDGNIPIDQRIKFAQENNLSVVIETKTEEALRKSVKRLGM